MSPFGSNPKRAGIRSLTKRTQQVVNRFGFVGFDKIEVRRRFWELGEEARLPLRFPVADRRELRPLRRPACGSRNISWTTSAGVSLRRTGRSR